MMHLAYCDLDVSVIQTLMCTGIHMQFTETDKSCKIWMKLQYIMKSIDIFGSGIFFLPLMKVEEYVVNSESDLPN